MVATPDATVVTAVAMIFAAGMVSAAEIVFEKWRAADWTDVEFAIVAPAVRLFAWVSLSVTLHLAAAFGVAAAVATPDANEVTAAAAAVFAAVREVDAESSAEVDAEISAEFDAESSSEVDAERGAEVVAESSAEVDAERGAEVDAESGAEVVVDILAGADSAVAPLRFPAWRFSAFRTASRMPSLTSNIHLHSSGFSISFSSDSSWVLDLWISAGGRLYCRSFRIFFSSRLFSNSYFFNSFLTGLKKDSEPLRV